MIIPRIYILRVVFTPVLTAVTIHCLPFFNYQSGSKINELLMIIQHVFMTNNEDLILNIIVLCALRGVGLPGVMLMSGCY
ncbi:hypothetical protein D9738_06765 [Escherichia sp. E10V5]|nr:hypothetical protein D9738_06765 [Escherichia sp. E10V5]